jgi:hypothetical protein
MREWMGCVILASCCLSVLPVYGQPATYEMEDPDVALTRKEAQLAVKNWPAPKPGLVARVDFTKLEAELRANGFELSDRPEREGLGYKWRVGADASRADGNLSISIYDSVAAAKKGYVIAIDWWYGMPDTALDYRTPLVGDVCGATRADAWGFGRRILFLRRNAVVVVYSNMPKAPPPWPGAVFSREKGEALAKLVDAHLENSPLSHGDSLGYEIKDLCLGYGDAIRQGETIRLSVTARSPDDGLKHEFAIGEYSVLRTTMPDLQPATAKRDGPASLVCTFHLPGPYMILLDGVWDSYIRSPRKQLCVVVSPRSEPTPAGEGPNAGGTK